VLIRYVLGGVARLTVYARGKKKSGRAMGVMYQMRPS
jgi:hypothetical protein